MSTKDSSTVVVAPSMIVTSDLAVNDIKNQIAEWETKLQSAVAEQVQTSYVNNVVPKLNEQDQKMAEELTNRKTAYDAAIASLTETYNKDVANINKKFDTLKKTIEETDKITVSAKISAQYQSIIKSLKALIGERN